MDIHTDLLIKFDVDEVSTQALIDWAIGEIGNDKDSESLNELAWLNHPPKAEARELYLKAIEELHYSLPSYAERKVLIAKRIAEKIVEGTKDVNEGCSELCEISRELDSPDNLSIFELLAHEQYDHESIGINSENIKPSIIDEARRLVDET